MAVDVNPTRHTVNIGSGRGRLPQNPSFQQVLHTPYTTTQKNALALGTAGKGTVIFDSTLGKLCVWTGSAWETVTSA